MDKLKLTKGPWRSLGCDGISCIVECVSTRDDIAPQIICDVYYVRPEDGGAANIEETEANAHIIAAAPDLLAALKEMILNGGSTRGEWVPLNTLRKAQSAVKKAEGKS